MEHRTLRSLMAVTMILVMIMAVLPAEAFAKSKAKKPKTVKIASLKAKGKKITLKWKKAKYAKKYQVYRKTGKGKWAKVKTLKSSKRTYTMSGKAGTKYSFKVRGLNGKKKGKFSKVKAVTLKAVIYKYHKNVYRVKKSVVSGYDVSESDGNIEADVQASGSLSIKKGGVTVLPASEEYPGGYAVKVSSFTKAGGKYSIKGTKPEYKDVFDELAVNKKRKFNYNKVKLGDNVKINDLSFQSYSVGDDFISVGDEGLSLTVEEDSFSATVTLSNPTLICDIDYSLGKIKSCKVGMSLDEDVSFAINTAEYEKKIQLLKGYAPIPEVPGLVVEYVIYLKVSVSGEASFEVQCTATSAIEYKNKKLKALPEVDVKEADIKASMTVEPGAGVDVGLALFDLDPLVSVKGELLTPLEAELIERILGKLSCLNIGITLKGNIGLGDCLLKEITEWEPVFEFDIHEFTPLHYEYKDEVWTKVKECAYEIYPDYTEYPEYYPIVREYKRVFDGEKLNTAVLSADHSGLSYCHCGVCKLTKGYLKDITGKYYWRDDPFYDCDMALDYALYDIDGNGKKELLVIDPTYEGYYSIWTLNGKTPVYLISSAYRARVIICKNGYLTKIMHGGAETSMYQFYELTGSAFEKEPYEILEDYGDYYINEEDTTREEFEQILNHYYDPVDLKKLEWRHLA